MNRTRYCSIFSCENYRGTLDQNIQFFKIPKTGIFHEKWMNVIKGHTRDSDLLSICSNHFYSNDLIKRDSSYVVRYGAVPIIQKNAAKILNGLITNGKAHKSTRSSINPTTKEVINFVDVNAVPKWEVESKRATTEVHSVCSEICRECIINETKLLGLKKKNDDIRKQYVELEKENESLKSQLAMHISTMIDTNDDISSGCNENCNICFATLTSHELCTHICIDLDEVTCEYCSETFKSINDLWNHLTNATIHDNAKSYQCDNCTKSFSAAILLKCHESTEHFELDLNTSLNKMFQCGICDSSFEQAMELKRHLGICHPSDESRLILRYQPLANYAITVNRFECYICKIQMKKIADVKDHIKQHSYGQTCKICNKYFMTIEEHQLHMCGAKKRSIICEYCDGSFSAISQLLSHLECEHDNRIMYKCRKCSKFFGMKRLRCLHENSPYHTVETEKLFACNQCSKRFWTRHNLKNHLQIHATERNFVCEQCGQRFKTAFTLRLHTAVHAEQSFQCPDCPTKCKSQLRLNVHRRSHQNVKYKCVQCTRACSSKSALRRHISVVHRLVDDRKFSCLLCPLKFNERNRLIRHQTSHNGEKRFTCKFCDRKYAYKGDLNKHLQIHVGENIYTCESCGMGFRLQIEYRRHIFQHYKEDKEKTRENSNENTVIV